MKKIFLFAIFISLNAFADSRGQAREERSWQPIEIQFTSGQVAATGFLTPDGHWRLNQIAPELAVSTQLKSPYAENMGLEQFTKLCSKMGYGFSSVRELQRMHSLKLSMPQWSEAVAGAKGPQVMKLLKVRSKVFFDAQANTLLYSSLDPRILERSIESQVQAQLPLLRSEGELEIIFTGHDYLACDFIAGRAHIGLEVIWEYPAAKLKHQTVINAEDLSRTILEAKSHLTEKTKCTDGIILASAILSAGMTSITQKTVLELGSEAFVSFFNAAYDSTTCRFRDLTANSLAEAAQEFDGLSEETVQSTSKIFARFNGVIQ